MNMWASMFRDSPAIQALLSEVERAQREQSPEAVARRAARAQPAPGVIYLDRAVEMVLSSIERHPAAPVVTQRIADAVRSGKIRAVCADSLLDDTAPYRVGLDTPIRSADLQKWLAEQGHTIRSGTPSYTELRGEHIVAVARELYPNADQMRLPRGAKKAIVDTCRTRWPKLFVTLRTADQAWTRVSASTAPRVGLKADYARRRT